MDPETVRLLLLGDEKCGKTTFLSYVFFFFPPSAKPSESDDGLFADRLRRHRRLSSGEGTGPILLLRDIDQPFVFNINLGDKKFRLEFSDTSSPDNWRLLEPDVIIICYDISQRLSLINMKRHVGCPHLPSSSKSALINYSLTIGPQWIDEVKKTFDKADTLPVIILGLKRDLRSEQDPNGIIYPQEAYQAAQTMRADRYVECSAVTGELLKLAFEDICKTATKTATATGGQSEGGCTIM